MAGTNLTSGSKKVISLEYAPIRIKEIKFNWGTGTNAIQLRNHVVSADVNPPEWEYDTAKRRLMYQSPIMKGEDVKKVQQQIMALNYDVGPQKDDGEYGKDTKKAIENFQKDNGLTIDGIVGPETRTFLGLQGGVAYKINTQFIIQVKFSAPNWIKSADIWAIEYRDGFGGLGSETDPSKPVTVNFIAGESGFCNFKIRTQPTTIFLKRTRWLWRCCNINGKTSTMKNMGSSEHIIYITCDTPQAPMDKPWIAVLHKACEWAKNIDDVDTAASKITELINDPPRPPGIPSGTLLFEYDTGQGKTYYASGGHFDCSNYLKKLNGGVGKGRKVNCTDCACMVTTFANALGCKLFESRMGDDFECNEIIPIGLSSWLVPFGWGFSYHEVAWKGSCGNADSLFDACLKVDGDIDPTTMPHTQLLPTNIVFHITGHTEYKERLATPSGQAKCNPLSWTKQRRTII